MPKRRLLWQLYPSYLVIILAAVIAIGWFAANGFQDLYLASTRDQLETQVRFVERRLGNSLASTQSDRLRASLNDLADATGTRLAVIDPAGRVRLDTRKPAVEGDSQINRAEIQAVLTGQPQWWVRSQDKQRVAHFAAPILRDDRVVGAVEASRPLGSLDSALVTMRRNSVLVGLGIALFATVLCSLVVRQIGRPVEEMRHAAERFARGELGYKLHPPEAEELAGLAEALNEMAEQLQQRISTIVRQNNEQKAVVSSMVEGVLAVDNQERVISLNKATGQLLGIDQSQAQGRRLQEVVRNADLRRFVTKVLSSSEPIDDDVVLHGDHEGVLQVRGAALHDANGRGIGAVVVLNDVTEFRRLEHIRRDFVANVSHELKTPITSIKGFVETLLDGAINNPGDAERFLKICAKQADRLNAIIEDLLSLSKIEQGEDAGDIALERGLVNEVLESAVHNCEPNATERKIVVRLHSEQGLAAEFNAPLLEQAVINLLDNAIKYSEPGHEVQVLGVRQADEVVITVSDQGCGIATEHLARVFERFYRIDKARSRKLGGTGLGLAIVKHIVQAHGGRVAVRSTLGQGSTFAIHLPAL